MAWLEAHPFAALIPVALVILTVIVPAIAAMRRIDRQKQRDRHPEQ
jgi:hypothetical protein